MEPIAIIGLGCRFPGAKDPDAYWRLLREGVDAVSEVPAERWNVENFLDPDSGTPGTMTTRCGGFLDDVSGFDPAFFGISRAEALAMDPQQRLMLELAFETLDDAGLPAERMAGTRTGVYTSFGMVEYCVPTYARPWHVGAYTNTGNLPCLIANRISYLLDLRGPSLSVDTACSSSLVAVHLACQAVRAGECDLALAGGVNFMLSPGFTIGYSQLNALSPTGRCHTFAANADGYVRGEGGGLVLIKPLAAAIEDGDDVRAVIHGSAINQDGRTNGLTAPNQFSQEDVLTRAYEGAAVDPAEVQYVEAHGTGTLLGDPIEARALGAVLGKGRSSDTPCALGSVKTNIGHLESAAGIAGLIKVVLAIANDEIPRSLHFDAPNPNIAFEALGLRVQQELGPWSRRPRLAGVSGFGFGGSNAHVVLGEPPRGEAGCEHVPNSGDGVYVLPLSAHSPQALQALMARYHGALRGSARGDSQPAEETPFGGAEVPHDDSISAADVCYSASVHRSQRDWRAGIVGASMSELLERLETERNADAVFYGRRRGGRRTKVAFVFTGQGAQYLDMGRALYATEPVFREAIEHCNELAGRIGNRTLESLLFEEPSCLDETRFTQPALFALEYALTRLWAAFGVTPDAVLGHSVGEYAAACAAGVVSVADGMKLARDRAAIMDGLPHGGEMAAVLADSEQVRSMLGLPRRDLDIAAVNAPQHTVISGRADALDESLKVLQAAGIAFHRLNVSHAFHSPLMDPVLDAIRRMAQGVTFHAPRIALVSNVTADVMREPLDGDYLARHARAPVQFQDGVKTLYEMGCRVFVEIGPHPVLSRVGRSVLPGDDCRWVPSLRRGKDDARSIAEGVAALFASGVEIDWRCVHARAPRRRVRLPLYPYQRQRLWDEHAPRAEHYSDRGPNPSPATVPEPIVTNDALQDEVRRLRARERPKEDTLESWSEESKETSPFALRHLDCPVPIFEGILAANSALWLTERRAGVLQVPEAAWVDLALTAYRERTTHVGERSTVQGPVAISQLRFEKPFTAGEDERYKVQCVIPDGDAGRFEVHSRDCDNDDSPWRCHALGHISSRCRAASSGPPLSDLRFRLRTSVEPEDFYAELATAGVELAPSQRCITTLHRRDGEALASLSAPTIARRADAMFAQRAMLSTALCVVAAAAPDGLLPASDVVVPARIGELRWFASLEGLCYVHVVFRAQAKRPEAELRVLDASGRLLVEITCLTSIAESQAQLVHGETAGSPQSLSATELQRRLPLAPPQERLELLQSYLAGLVAGALGVPAANLDPHDNVYRLGLDSLMIVRLRARIELELRVEVEVAQLMNEELTPSMLASHLLERIENGD